MEAGLGSSRRRACRRAVLGVIGAALSLTFAAALPARAGIKVIPGDGVPNRWLQSVFADRTAPTANGYNYLYFNGRATVPIRGATGAAVFPRVDDTGHVALQAPLGGIYLWQDSVARRLDDPARPGVTPVMNDLAQVAWVDAPPADGAETTRRGVNLWDGRRVRRIGVIAGTPTRDALSISNAGHVAWSLGDRICLWDGVQTREIPSPAGRNARPEVNETGQVVWVGGGETGANIYLWDGAAVQNLSTKLPRPWAGGSAPNAMPHINNRGQVCWSQPNLATAGNAATGRHCVWLWDGKAMRRVTSDEIGAQNVDPAIAQDGQLLWLGRDTETTVPKMVLYKWDGSSARQIGLDVLPNSYGFDREGNAVWPGSRYVADSGYGVAIEPKEITIGETAVGTIVLKTPAPRGGAVIQLALAGPQEAVTLPKTVSIAAGATRAAFRIQTTRPTRETLLDQLSGAGIPDGYDIIKATYNGVTEEAKLIVRGVTISPATTVQPRPVATDAAPTSSSALPDATPTTTRTVANATTTEPTPAPERPAAAATTPATEPAPERPAAAAAATTPATDPAPAPVRPAAAANTTATPAPEPTPALVRPAAATATPPVADPTPEPVRPAAADAATRPAANATTAADPTPAPVTVVATEPVTRPAANTTTTLAPSSTPERSAAAATPPAADPTPVPERPAAAAANTTTTPATATPTVAAVRPATPSPAPSTSRAVPSATADMLQRMAELLKALGM